MRLSDLKTRIAYDPDDLIQMRAIRLQVLADRIFLGKYCRVNNSLTMISVAWPGRWSRRMSARATAVCRWREKYLGSIDRSMA